MSADETIISSLDDLQKQTTSADPYLIIIAGTNIGKLYHLSASELVAGRSPECDIWIEDSTISRKHFQIRKVDSAYTIQDLKSTNGTFVNNKRIISTTLKAGDKIQVSKDTIIQFDFFDEDRKISEQKRYEMGVRDAVTGIFNKSYFVQRISDEFSFSLRQNLPLSLLLFDIDYFKTINDTYGHLAGDKILQDLCQVVSGTIRTDDVFCRYGGEEFIIIMRNTACQPAVNLAERIRRKVEQTPFMYDDENIKVTISVGVATSHNKNFRDYISLIADTDKFLYQSKAGGRNRVSAVCLPQVN
jgi:diguanylate cyclase (GGDEF)-like protein